MKGLAVLMAALACTAASAQEPLTIKGLGVGSTREEVVARLPDMTCVTPDNCGVIVHKACGNYGVVDEEKRAPCIARYSYAGIQPVMWHVVFYRGQVASVGVTFHESELGDVIAALRERFGQPTKATAGGVQWQRVDALLDASKNPGATRSSVTLINLNATAARDADLEQKKRRAAKDRAKDL